MRGRTGVHSVCALQRAARDFFIPECSLSLRLIDTQRDIVEVVEVDGAPISLRKQRGLDYQPPATKQPS